MAGKPTTTTTTKNTKPNAKNSPVKKNTAATTKNAPKTAAPKTAAPKTAAPKTAAPTKKATTSKKVASVPKAAPAAKRGTKTTATTKSATAASGTRRKATTTKNTKGNTTDPKRRTATKKVKEVPEILGELSEDISRKSYKIDKKGRAYRSYRLESFDGVKPDMEHSATQNTKYPLNSDQYKDRNKGLSFGLGPRNAASKMLTSLCSHDRKLAKSNPNHTPYDVLNKNYVMVIKETTRGNRQRTFIYSCFRVKKDDIDYQVKCDDPENPNIKNKTIKPEFTNKLYAMESETGEHKMTPQQFAKKENEKKKI